jgi:GNAT superfamily N-acetyltransferase
MEFELRVGFAVDDVGLSRLHDAAFGEPGPVLPWAARLERHSVAWVGAFARERIVGFVHAVWDGGLHAFLLDTAVDPGTQGQGIGSALVARLVEEVRAAGCEWLHVDFEPHLAGFYARAGFAPTDAGLLRLH